MKKKVQKKYWFIYATILIVISIMGILFYNQMNTNFEDLSDTEQKILYEIEEYYKANSKSQVWQDFHPEKRAVLALDGSFGKAFLINPTAEVSNLFAKQVKMPEDSKLEVYRISILSPQLLQFRLDGNFNTIGKKYNIFNNEVYYINYANATTIDKEFDSKHFISLLSHESFHYYMQDTWAGGGQFSVDGLTDQDIKLLGMEYEVLEKINEHLLSNHSDRELLLEYTKEYVAIMEQRIKQNPKYLEEELSKETAEGTASYVGMKASKMVGYDLGVMYFENVKNVSFLDVISNLENGGIEKSFLANRMPYETGAQLCLLMDALNISNWQHKLNQQTLENPVTLYSILKEYSEKQ